MPSPGERFDRAEGSQPYKPESRALDPREVVIETGWNVRDMFSPDTREHVAALKASILARGVDKAISVRYDKVSGITTLVDGQCRLTACRELWEEGTKVFVPAIRVTGDEAELTAESLTSNAGHPLTQWEIGSGCRRLVKFGWTVAQIADHICKSPRYVTEALSLADSPIEAKAMLSAGTVTAGAVLHAVKNHGQEAVKVLKDKVEAQPKDSKPIARPKKPSVKEFEYQHVPTVLELADAMYRLILDPNVALDELESAAKAYGKARNI